MRIFGPFLFVLFSSLAFAKTNNADSLVNQIQRIALEDTIALSNLINEAISLEDNQEMQAYILLNAGSLLVSNYEYERADFVLRKCLMLALADSTVAEANFQFGLSYMYRDIRLRSLKHFNTALEKFTVLEDSLGMGKSLDKIADNYNYIGEHETARPYYDRCIEIFTNIRDTARLTNVLGNIGGMMSEEANHEGAVVFYNRAIRLNEQSKNLRNLSSDLAGLGIAEEGLGHLEEALTHYHRALRVARQIEDEEMEAFAHQHLGYFHFRRGNLDSAEFYMSITNEYAKRMNYAQLLINSMEVLHQVAYTNGEYQKAYEIFKEAQILQDTLMSQENVSLISSLRSEYENAALQQQADLREEVIQKQKKLTTTLIVGAILLGIAIIALVWLNEKRRRKNLIIQRDRDLIREQSEKLKELDATKSTFFANISHDIRAPVALIKGFVDLLKSSDKSLTEESKVYVDHIEDTVERLTKMTEEINQLIQLEENRYQLKRTDIVIADFFGTLAKMFETGNRNNDIRFGYKLSVESGQVINADQSALEKIVFNVVGNAFKYNTTGNKVNLDIILSENNLVIKVTDDGPGILEERIERVFDRYYRSASGSNMAGGQGIGLSLVKDLVELHDGEISVVSVPNEETCFTIKLPLNTQN